MFDESLASICAGHLGDIEKDAVVCSPFHEEWAVIRWATGR